MYHACYFREFVRKGKSEIFLDLYNLHLAVMNTILEEDGMLNTSTEIENIAISWILESVVSRSTITSNSV